MKVLYQGPPHPGGGAVWTVTQDPTMAGNPCLVRFTRRNSKRKLLDQTAEWLPAGWNPHRWTPRAPMVPQWLIDKIEDRMRQEVGG